jgi:hypothetical protein
MKRNASQNFVPHFIPKKEKMKVTGFTFIKDAIKYDYPIIEAITSILPICDEFVVAVGKSSDETLALILGINSPKIRIIQTVWDETQREGGRVLAIETDKAFRAISSDTDWAFYIQGDEVVHEKFLETIYNSMKTYKDMPEIDGLLFNYLHFYGSYDYVGCSSGWYDAEIRIVRNNPNIYSYKDAQGFRRGDNQKLLVKKIDAFVYHYGWVKEPKAMQEKQLNFNKYWHDDDWVAQNVAIRDEFDYTGIDALRRFEDTHPVVMLPRIQQKNWHFDFDLSLNRTKLKDKLKAFLKKYIGIDLNYRNYRLK